MSTALELEVLSNQPLGHETRADKINRLHLEACSGIRTTIEVAIQIGSELVQQKDELKHGEWLPWLEANMKFSVVTAQRYMRVHLKNANASLPTHLTIDDGARLLGPAPKAPKKPGAHKKSKSKSKKPQPAKVEEVAKSVQAFTAADRKRLAEALAKPVPVTPGAVAKANAEAEEAANPGPTLEEIKNAVLETSVSEFDEDEEVHWFEEAALMFTSHEDLDSAYKYLEQFSAKGRKRLLEIFKAVDAHLEFYLAPFGRGSMATQIGMLNLGTQKKTKTTKK